MISTEIISIFTAIAYSVVSVCSSRELPITSKPSFTLSPSLNAVKVVNDDNGSHDKYDDRFPSIRNFSEPFIVQSPRVHSLTSSKKLIVTSTPGYYLQDPEFKGEIRNITDIVPFLVDNVIRPIIKHVLVNQNVYTYFQGSSASTETPLLSSPHNTEPTLTTPKTSTFNPVVISNKTTENPVTEKNGNDGRDLLQGGVTTSSSKTKYRVRFRERTSTSTTRKTYAVDEDDEDDSEIFNKVKLI